MTDHTAIPPGGTPHPRCRRDRAGDAGGPRRGRVAFTIVELLIVISVIIVLLSLLIVGLNIATKTSQEANTRALMQSLKQGLVRFEGDVGYYPPVLDNARRLLEGPDRRLADQTWYSWTSLAEYLVGYATDRYDGYGNVSTGEVPLTGIRHPSSDGVWGAGPGGTIDDRNPVPPRDGGPSQVYGPYIELDDPRLLAGIDPTGRIVFPGDDPNFGDYPKVIVDYWGEPIHYFRRNYPRGALGQSYRSILPTGGGAPAPVPTLSDFVCLRPYRVDPGAGTDARFGDASSIQDTTTSLALEAGEFALFSKGPDRDFDPDRRVDAEELNRDNIVEVGP